jgi:death on curing protein
MPDPVFLELEDVLLLHEQQLARYGGGAGIRDLGLLESAVATPLATFGGEYLHAGLFEMAAAYAFHISQNQPFVDGNKRTGLVGALVFLELNGILVTDPAGELYDAMIGVAEHRFSKDYLAKLLRKLGE